MPAAFLDTTLLCDLSHLAVLRITGDDRLTFLQGQLSNDVRLVDTEHGQLTSWSTPKGRLLAVIRLLAQENALLMLLEGSLCEGIAKRLRMYVLRSKVVIEDTTSAFRRLGLAGPDAETALRAAGLVPPQGTYDCTRAGSVAVLRVEGPVPRFLLLGPPASLDALQPAFAAHALSGNESTWRLHEILAGVPTIYSATQDRFVPQAANLDRLGGIHFRKGCYTGQEIVARLHYLGRLKRRMFLFHTEATHAMPGMPVYDAIGNDQSIGDVVDAQPHPEGGMRLLAVVQIEAALGGSLRLGARNGPALVRQALPYAVPEAEQTA